MCRRLGSRRARTEVREAIGGISKEAISHGISMIINFNSSEAIRGQVVGIGLVPERSRA